jgi:molybdopterin-guanine dinucleotide biosynthesis protein A
MPAITRPDLEWFVGALAARPDAAGIMGTRNDVTEPLPCALRPAALRLVEDRLQGGRRSLHGLADDAGFERVDAGGLPDRVWQNVNTPAEWERFLREAGPYR